MLPVNPVSTNQLINLINHPFQTGDAMQLVQLGADPNTKKAQGTPLLHIIAQQVPCRENIITLVQTYNADINIQDAAGNTLLKRILTPNFNAGNAMFLVSLGADPETKNKDDKSLLALIKDANPNGRTLTHQLIEMIEKKHADKMPAKKAFLEFLIDLSNERHNKALDSSFFKTLPIELMLHIISFLDFEAMGKTHKEGTALAKVLLSEARKKEIKKMAGSIGGINIFQHKNPQTFTFFKSPERIWANLEVLALTLQDQKNHRHPLIEKLLGVKLTNSSKETLIKTIIQSIPYLAQQPIFYNRKFDGEKLIAFIKKYNPTNAQLAQIETEVSNQNRGLGAHTN